MDMIDNSSLSQNNDDYRKLIGASSFAITARIAMQLGRESISNSIVAIIELVKNSYDADAENVQIRFSGLGNAGAILVINDDGNGMNYQQFTDGWLVIGTDNKLITQKSKQKKRPLTGEKGLGRLGLDRLSEKTLIQTFTEDNDAGIELEIDWKRYENTNVKLESIEHSLFQIPKTIVDPISGELSTKLKGTRLILRGLKDIWTDEDLRKLQMELALLVSPFGGINDFSIEFFSDTAQHLNGRIASDDLLEAADWKVASHLLFKEDGTACLHHFISSPLREATFEFPLTPWSEVFPDQRHYIPQCGPLYFEFYFIPREDVAALSLKKAQIDKFMDANQGLRIYRDGFRVMPYGKPNGEGDWLTLNMRRTRSPGSVRSTLGGWKLGYNQVVGAVFIEREKNGALLDQTNREGIVEGPAFYDLRRFALHSIEFFERQRQLYEKAQGSKNSNDEFEKARTKVEVSTQASREVVEQLKSTIDSTVQVLTQTSKEDPEAEKRQADLSNKLSQMVDILNQRVTDQQNDQQELLKAADKREEERQEEFQKQKDTLGNLASLGILATTFGHETEASSTLVIANSDDLKHNVGRLYFVDPVIAEDINENVETIIDEAKRINTFAGFTLRNVSRDKRQRTNVHLDKLIKKVFESFSSWVEQERNIKLTLDFPPDIPAIHAFSIDWESIIINFMTNAIWALDNTPGSDRQIRVRLREIGDHLRLSFADSGIGIAAGTADSIFLPTISTKRNRNGDVIGTGMGLAIVQNFVDAYNGTIRVESPCDLGGAEFHIEVAFRGKK